MRYVIPLQSTEVEALEQQYQHSPTHRERQRCQALLLSNKGNNVKALSELFGAERDTIQAWLKRWEKTAGQSIEFRLASLLDAPRSGRPSRLEYLKKKS